MLKSCLVYVFIGIISTNAQFNSVEGGHDFDLLIFTQQWPATTCKEWKKNPSHTCSMPSKNDIWTIHGIWPTKLGTIGPAFCNRTWLFDPEKIRPIENELTQVWVNIFGGTSVYALWTHEWTKHGTCAAALEPLNSEFKYFSMGIDWLNKYAVGDILTAANITPSNSKEYSLADINNAIKEKLGVDPVIECKREDGQNYISEIRICFTKDLQPIDCDGVVRRTTIEGVSVLTNCHTSEDIVYPHYNQFGKLYVELYKLATWLRWFTM